MSNLEILQLQLDDQMVVTLLHYPVQYLWKEHIRVYKLFN